MKYCYYHSIDSDGHASGAVVKKAIPDVTLLPYNYGDFDLTTHVVGDVVYFVDAVPQPYLKMKQLFNIIGSGLHIIDHHKSAIESLVLQELKELLPNNIVLSDKHAACRLCWEHLFPETEVPISIGLISQYDNWDTKGWFDWDDMVLPYQMGLRLQNTDPIKTSVMLDRIDDALVPEICKEGKIVLTYQNQQNAFSMNLNSFETVWEGYNFLCINSTQSNMQLFESLYDETRHDFMCRFCLNSMRQVSVSIYSTKEDRDASAIAIKFGGGGHKKAAGFSVALEELKVTGFLDLI